MTSTGLARRLGIELFLVLCCGFVLGLFGPFGTYQVAAPVRLAYWMVFGVAGYALFRPMIVLGKWVSDEFRVSHAIGVGFGMAVAAVPMTMLVALLLSGFHWPIKLSASGFGQLYFQVWLIGFVINGLMTLLFRDKPEVVSVAAPEKIVTAATPPAQIDPSPSFADRLPAGFGPVLALQGEDHYVRVHGDSRSELILVRLRDAMAELGETAGIQVHRSWWVAHDAIASVERDGRVATLVLTNGLRVPVSRENMPRIRDRL